MAANLYSDKLSKSKFRNWLKAGLGVHFTKEGITPFVCEEIEQFQQKCLSDICNNNGLSAGTTCSSCSTENVVVCPTNRICNTGRGRCTFHRDYATQYIPSGCPDKICHNFKKEIQNAHRYSGPSYRNTDASQWCSNPWEVAKCFMPPDGYKDVVSATGTDFNGINSVIINFKDIQLKMHADLSKKNNIFNQGRDVGKAVRHSADLVVEDTELQTYFAVLQNVLSDPAYLAANTAAQNAKQKLSQLLNDTLVIGKDDVRKVLDDAAKVAQDNIRNEKEEYKKKAEKQKLELIEITNNSLNEIEKQGQISMSELDKALKSAVDKIKRQTNESIIQLQAEADTNLKRIAAKGDTVAEKAIKKIKLESDAAGQTFQKKAEQAFQQIDEKSTTNAEEKYKKQKDELKYALVTFYEVNHSGIPLSPLFEEKETQLEGFYVMPQLESIEMTETLSSGAEITKTPVKSLSELFKSDRKIAREIYLMADAGFGKTAFSKYLAVMWCHAHSPDGQSSKEDHLNALSEFEFLFLVSLRESSGVCNIDDMIKQQIVPHLSFSSPLSNKHLQEILHREKFLVILDGLDEWNHPKTDCTIFSKNIPHRIARKNCTVLTTTRPWKLSVINLKTSQIDRKIELVKLNEDTARQLQFNVLQKIHANFDDEELKRKTNDFNEEIRDYDLDDLKCVPLLLMYLIILWCDKIPLGQSKCGLYTSIIELLLSRTVKKYPDLHPTCEPSQRDIPQCFSEHEHFERYFPFLTVLGRLAFHTLFSKTRENMLVFDSSIAKTFLNESELKLSLQSGILTQSKVQVKSTKQSSKISFSHRSVQEYLSALYMSYPSESDVQKIILQNCKSLQNIVDMSAVFVYISGMNAKLISSISPELMSVIDKDKITNTYRCMAGYGYSSPLKYIQNMYISCIKENLDNNDLKLCLQDFFIDETCQQENYRTTLERLAKQNKNNIKSVSIENEDLGSLREIIDSFELTDLNNLQRIFCRGECEEADIIRLLFRTVKHAGVAPSISCSMTSALCERIQSLPQLEGICMEGFEISHAVLEEFLNYLTNRKSMKEIRLYSLNYTDHGISCDGAKLDLSQHTELRTLGLSEIPLSQLNMNVASLEECVVGYLYKPDLVSSYLSQLPAASKLNILKCVSLQSAGDIKTLLQILPLLVHVKKVTLWNINLGEMSPQMVNIERVVLMSVTISSSSFRNLVKQTEQLPHSVKVEIHGCTITPEPECEAVKQYVRTSESFVVTRDKKYLFVFVKSAVTTTTAD